MVKAKEIDLALPVSQEECPAAASGSEDVDLPPLKTRLILAMEEAWP